MPFFAQIYLWYTAEQQMKTKKKKPCTRQQRNDTQSRCKKCVPSKRHHLSYTCVYYVRFCRHKSVSQTVSCLLLRWLVVVLAYLSYSNYTTYKIWAHFFRIIISSWCNMNLRDTDNRADAFFHNFWILWQMGLSLGKFAKQITCLSQFAVKWKRELV